MSKFIHIRSDKFPVLPGEEDEVVNEGMYGKALALYLQSKLTERGYKAGFVVAEDWGWWVDIDGPPFTFGVCIYASPDGTNEYVCTDGAPARENLAGANFDSLTQCPSPKNYVLN